MIDVLFITPGNANGIYQNLASKAFYRIVHQTLHFRTFRLLVVENSIIGWFFDFFEH